MKAKIFLLMPLTALLFTGCLIVPVPSKNESFGKVITPHDVKFIVRGHTTRAEVVAKLGDEFRDVPRLSVIAYTWEKPGVSIDWYGALVNPLGAWVGGKLGRSSSGDGFVLKFDADGRVATADYFSVYDHQSLDEQLEEWALEKNKRFGASIFNPDTGVPWLFEDFEWNK